MGQVGFMGKMRCMDKKFIDDIFHLFKSTSDLVSRTIGRGAPSVYRIVLEEDLSLKSF